MTAKSDYALSKVPEVTLIFWVIKIAATTLGETGGDAVTMSMNLGYLVGSAIFATIFVVAIAAQINAREFRTLLFWAAFILTRPLGATVGDLLDKPHADGGLALTRYLASAVIATFILACLLFLPQGAEQRQPA